MAHGRKFRVGLTVPQIRVLLELINDKGPEFLEGAKAYGYGKFSHSLPAAKNSLQSALIEAIHEGSDE